MIREALTVGAAALAMHLTLQFEDDWQEPSFHTKFPEQGVLNNAGMSVTGAFTVHPVEDDPVKKALDIMEMQGYRASRIS